MNRLYSFILSFCLIITHQLGLAYLSKRITFHCIWFNGPQISWFYQDKMF
jgi:hypothetical protein